MINSYHQLWLESVIWNHVTVSNVPLFTCDFNFQFHGKFRAIPSQGLHQHLAYFTRHTFSLDFCMRKTLDLIRKHCSCVKSFSEINPSVHSSFLYSVIATSTPKCHRHHRCRHFCWQVESYLVFVDTHWASALNSLQPKANPKEMRFGFQQKVIVYLSSTNIRVNKAQTSCLMQSFSKVWISA